MAGYDQGVSTSGATKFTELSDTPSDYTGQGRKSTTVNEAGDGLVFELLPSAVTILFDNIDARFLAEKGLPDLQGWTLTQSVNSTITVVSDNIFGEVKDAIKFDADDDFAVANHPITGEDWDYALLHGFSFSSIVRFTEDVDTNALFSGMGFDAANDPRTASSVRSRTGVTISHDGTYTTVQLYGSGINTLDGQDGRLLVLKDEWFIFDVVGEPTPDNKANFGAVHLYVNGILVRNGGVASSNDVVDNVVAIQSSSSTGETTFYVANFGATIYKESPIKLLNGAEMPKSAITVIEPSGKRDYEIIIPDGFPRAIGSSIRIIANNAIGTVTLRAEDLNAPQALFNGLNSLEIYIESKKEVLFTNIVDGGNVYQATLPHKDVMSHNHNDTVNIDIYNIKELEKYFGHGTYNVENDVSIRFMADIVIDGVFNIANGADFIIQGANHATIINFTNTGTIFTNAGDAEVRITQGKFIFSGVGATILNIDVTSYYQSWATFTCTAAGITIGSITSSNILLVKDSANTGFTDGLTVDTNFLALTSALYRGTFQTANTLIKINKLTQASITDSILATGPGETMLDIRPDIEASIQLDGITKVSKLGNFFKSGDIGSITLFTDASISAQAIVSVTDSAGVARFNYTGDTVYVSQKVVISGFVTNTAYNTTVNEADTITASGAGYFEIASVAFGSDEAIGVFDSDSVIVTSATHGLSDADTLLITDTMNYNAGHKIYNSLTDTFQVNATFNTAETAGTWDTGSLTQDSKYLNVIHAGDQRASSTGTAMSVKDNILDTTIAASVWNTLNLNTAALGDLNSRFVLLDSSSGLRRYEGLFPINIAGSVSISAKKADNSDDAYSFRMYKTLGTDPFDDVEMTRNITNIIGTVSLTFSGKLFPGDEFRPEVMGLDATTKPIKIASYSDTIK